MRIKGLENKADDVMGVCYLSPSQDDKTDELFHKQLEETSGYLAFVLMGDFKFPDINWEHYTAVTNKSRKFLKALGCDFLSQVLSEPARKDALLDFLFMNKKGLVGDVIGRKLSLPQ